MCGSKDSTVDTLGEEKELEAAKGTGVEDMEAAESPVGFGGGVLGGVVSIPLSSIIFLQLFVCWGPERVRVRQPQSEE